MAGRVRIGDTIEGPSPGPAAPDEVIGYRAMAERAAIVTGASSGIGLAIAHMLGQEGHDLTVAARRPDKLETAAQELRDAGYEVESVAANMSDEADIRSVVERHRDRFGRLDVLVNNAGVGIGSAVGDTQTKKLDMQLDVNLRAIVLFYRECDELLRAAGAEHGNALVVNTASIAGKSGQGWLSVYSATKHGVVGFTQAMNRELKDLGIKSTALCPGFVDTPMTDFLKQTVPAESLIQVQDVVESVRFLLRLSPGCVVPEVVFTAPGGELMPSA
jgi:NAD(P)-dependent dehydrogenase (short-subunit alcohol dehydrogenase family)